MSPIGVVAATCAAVFIGACGEQTGAPPALEENARPEPVGVIASDAIAELPAAPTGVDFWTHPNVAFNSLIIVASADGIASYNVEDGAEVSRVPGIALNGVAVSYIGFGPLAAGVAAAFDEDEGAFHFYGIDNVSRLFLPLPGGPSIRGAVRGFCMGRAATNADPTLFVVQRGELTIFNVTPAMDGEQAGVAIAGETALTIPDAATTCAVGPDGVVYIAGDGGDIFRVDGDDAFNAPFAIAASDAPADMDFLSTGEAEDAPFVGGQLAILDGENGIVEFFDATDGHALGAVRITATDAIEAVETATAMGASAANLGGLYRDGAIALGVDGDAPAARLIPANGVANALGLAPLPPANPRGVAPAQAESNNLIINPTAPIGDGQ